MSIMILFSGFFQIAAAPLHACTKSQPKKTIAKKIIVKTWHTFEATFYNQPCKSCNITKSGRKLKTGVTISVDPRVIPLGSWVEIRYPDGKVEKRRADDTGKAVKGHIVDVFVPKPRKQLLQMGRQQVKLRIISLPKGDLL